ncbi:hypothetical protein NP233_g7120 [Leucocoprinus birnbaumii]|uniref:Uncharacterized protein n=1 Tax=Leucocoprinus birnbaumii TaxID=56174 RepID=A0AAD5VPT8_9AGAR|nr:hypothetical protein NP233_g7120 [Leucocoprinus birnbaumii]
MPRAPRTKQNTTREAVQDDVLHHPLEGSSQSPVKSSLAPASHSTRPLNHEVKSLPTTQNTKSTSAPYPQSPPYEPRLTPDSEPEDPTPSPPRQGPQRHQENVSFFQGHQSGSGVTYASHRCIHSHERSGSPVRAGDLPGRPATGEHSGRSYQQARGDVVDSYDGYDNFMASFGLKPWESDDMLMAENIIDTFAEYDRDAYADDDEDEDDSDDSEGSEERD